MLKRTFKLPVLAAILAVLILAGCGTPAVTPTATSTATPEPTATESAPEAPTAEAPTATPQPPTPTPAALYIPVEIPEAGLEFDVPADWVRLEPDWIWAPNPESELRLGVKWEDLNPPEEPEAVLLPDDSQIVDTTPVDLDMGTARRFLMSVYGPAVEGGDEEAVVESVQIHVIAVPGGDIRRAYDFYAVAPQEARLSEVQPALQHMLDTVALQPTVEDPTARIRARIAEELDVQVEQVQMVDMEPVEWPDACLGLPEEGEMCATVITPGYRITAQVGDEVYTVRANEDGTRVIVIPPAVSKGRAVLAQEIGASEDAVELVNVEAVEWDDACLGIEQEGQVCAQVLTPGYRVIFRVNGQRYEVHTDETGEAVGIAPNE